MNFLIQAKDVGFQVGERVILDRVSLDVPSGCLMTIIGPNGSGKSTLLKILLGLMPPTRGRVHRLPDLKIGYMPQKLFIDHSMPISVIDFLTLSSAQLNIQDVLAQVGMNERQNHLMHTLSGGEFQRVLLARSLLQNPNLLVLDEPVQGVDIMGQADIYRLIQEIQQKIGCTVLLVSHDLHFVHAASDHVICLNQHICCQGQPQDIQKNPGYLSLFGHDVTTHISLYQHHHNHRHDV